ncbi:hypothetical protein DPMN_082079 [Dreissena polymorpha]|uniref:Uncharacterized protein n=1 Tax=Dreissena polymorpha TaxID=45954 RepID=A0A9D3YA84_DREPO|nr:hypothetical protein DPMN_082079 [Dreissena polymorpha]
MHKAIVYIWESNKKDQALGHASMSLSNGTHTSWWPNREIGKWELLKSFFVDVDIPANPRQTLADDISGEEDNLPTTYVLNLSNKQLDNIQTWWIGFKATNSNWSLKKMNCSTVVSLALDIAFPGMSRSPFKVWTPSLIEMLMWAMNASPTMRKLLVAKVQFPMDLLRQGEIDKLFEHLKNQLEPNLR